MTSTHTTTPTGTVPAVAIGAGRMGRGIALAHALRDRECVVIDFKQREAAAFSRLAQQAREEIGASLTDLALLGVHGPDEARRRAGLVTVLPWEEAATALSSAETVYECVPETREAKMDAFARLEEWVTTDAVIASTTSTMLSTELASWVHHPHRLLNAHWLNPAFIHMLVEVSPHPGTDPELLTRFLAGLEELGKVPVVCAPSPGFIVPRLQALIMNEAARLVEEGVASPADIDTATRYGLGLRFAATGVLEFIDFGGNDILYHADEYLAETVDAQRYRAPDIVRTHMAEGRNGVRTGAGFHTYDTSDPAAYRRDVLRRTLAFAAQFPPGTPAQEDGRAT